MTPGPLLALLLLGQARPEEPAFDPAVHEAAAVFNFDDFRIVPVRVHLLSSDEVDGLNSRLKEEDVRRIFSKVNRIWNRAGLALAVDRIVREEARVPADFDPLDLASFRRTRPPGPEADRLHVYFVHRLPVNGVYFGKDAIFVKDTASLRPVRGGVDEPIPRVTSHEIGHAFGLPHRQDTINLMASGTTGWSLNDAEILAARTWAIAQDWIWTPARALEQGQAALLAALPGDSPIKNRALEAVSER
jgi:hypothetical protein